MDPGQTAQTSSEGIPRHWSRSRLVLLATLLSLLFWLIDSFMDVYLFKEEESFLQSLLQPESSELWMRSLVTFLLIAFSLFAHHLMKSTLRANLKLEKHKQGMESSIEAKTLEIRQTNEKLMEEIRLRKIFEKELIEIATVDALTLVMNRRKFDEILAKEIEREIRYNNGLSIVLFDVDNFKSINDKFGHLHGDEFLKLVAKQAETNIRKSDYIARWGGEEFVLLLPSSSEENARSTAEKLRTYFEEHACIDEVCVTASFGIAHYRDKESEGEFIDRADNALYKAKHSGKNCVCVES